MKDYYEILNIDKDAGIRDIKKAFHGLAKQFHPDVSRNQSTFLKILEAYKTLTDKEKRKAYNNTILQKSWEKKFFIPKNRVMFAISLLDIAQLRTFNYGGLNRRRRYYNHKGYDVIVNLTENELFSGATVNIDIPAHVICPLCRGDSINCTFCSNKGYILKAVSVPVSIPLDLKDSEVFEISLKDIKLKEYAYFMIKKLRVRIKIFQE